MTSLRPFLRVGTYNFVHYHNFMQHTLVDCFNSLIICGVTGVRCVVSSKSCVFAQEYTSVTAHRVRMQRRFRYAVRI